MGPANNVTDSVSLKNTSALCKNIIGHPTSIRREAVLNRYGLRKQRQQREDILFMGRFSVTEQTKT